MMNYPLHCGKTFTRQSLVSKVWNIKYIKAILNNWSKKGIKTLVEAQKESQSFKGKKEEKKSAFEQREYNDLSYLYANGG